MTGRIYRAEDKKDQYIYKELLPYFLERIKEIDDIQKRKQFVSYVASMIIFPFKTTEGPKLGSLSEQGISWYFLPDDKHTKQISKDSYRILDLSVMNSELKTTFKTVYGKESGYGYIAQFSDAVVMNDIIQEMSRETAYTRQWWVYAKDLFELWNKKDYLDSFIHATERIKTNHFLFL